LHSIIKPVPMYRSAADRNCEKTRQIGCSVLGKPAIRPAWRILPNLLLLLVAALPRRAGLPSPLFLERTLRVIVRFTSCAPYLDSLSSSRRSCLTKFDWAFFSPLSELVSPLLRFMRVRFQSGSLRYGEIPCARRLPGLASIRATGNWLRYVTRFGASRYQLESFPDVNFKGGMAIQHHEFQTQIQR
jgi:hypothetical protein